MRKLLMAAAFILSLSGVLLAVQRRVSSQSDCLFQGFTAENYATLAEIDVKRGDYERAVTDYTCVLQLDPASAAAYFHRANAYDRLGQWIDARNDLTQAINLYFQPLSAAHTARGSIYSKLRQYDLAVADFTWAIDEDWRYTPAYFNRGYVYLQRGEYERAAIDYTYVILLDFDNERAYNNRGYAYRNLGAIDLAIGDHTRAIVLNPDKAVSYRERALDYWMRLPHTRSWADFGWAFMLSIKDFLRSEMVNRASG